MCSIYGIQANNGIKKITSNDGSVTIVNPKGATTDLSVIGGGGGSTIVTGTTPIVSTFNGVDTYDVSLIPAHFTNELLQWNNVTSQWELQVSDNALQLGNGAKSNTIGGLSIGNNAGGDGNQGETSIAIGQDSGAITQGENSIAIGTESGNVSQADNAIAIGKLSGKDGQKADSIAIGVLAGEISQSSNGIAIGQEAGKTSQTDRAIAIGQNSGWDTQGLNSIGIGFNAGNDNQGNDSIAIGTDSGKTTQSADALAVGYSSGGLNQGTKSVAVGYQAGEINQGLECIALGYQAGATLQPNNSFFVGTTNVRDVSVVAPTGGKNLAFDPASGEIYTSSLNEGTASYKMVSPVTISLNADYTYLASDFLSGIILRDSSPNDVDDTTPDASAIISAITFPLIDMSFDVTIYNISNKEVKEINPGVGVTFIVPTGVTDWKIKKDEARTVTVVITSYNPGGTVDMYSTRHHTKG